MKLSWLFCFIVFLISCTKQEIEGYEYKVVTIHEDVVMTFRPHYDSGFPNCGISMICKFVVDGKSTTRFYKSIKSLQGMNLDGKYKATIKVFTERFVCENELIDPGPTPAISVRYYAEILEYEHF